MRHVLGAIDAHVAGQTLRLVTEGFPRPAGHTMRQKSDWLRRHADHLRRAVVLEPRGHRDLVGAVLTEPVSPGADAGAIFMDASGYPAISGHAVIAIVTIGLERRLLYSRDHTAAARLVLDTTAGTVHATAHVEQEGDRGRVTSVSFTNVPSFVLAGGLAVRVGTRALRADIAFGGVFFAITDAEAAGIPLVPSRIPELRRLAVDIRASLNLAAAATHPVDVANSGIAGVVFTGPPQDSEAHLRSVTIFGEGSLDRSPCPLAMTAVMAVLDEMGLLQDGQSFVHESILGFRQSGRIVRRTQVGSLPSTVTEVEGSAWITGEHTFHLNEGDPLSDGFAI